MKKILFIPVSLLLAIILGVGIAVMMPQEVAACGCELGYPPVPMYGGICPKDPNLILIYEDCVGRYVCPPYGPCHCSYKRCVKGGVPTIDPGLDG